MTNRSTVDDRRSMAKKVIGSVAVSGTAAAVAGLGTFGGAGNAMQSHVSRLSFTFTAVQRGGAAR